MPHSQLDLGVTIVPELHARKSWIAACDFHDLGVEPVLNEVYQRVSEHVRLKNSAIVLLDLDSTLYEVGTRTHFILQEWAQSPLASSHTQARSAILQMKYENVGYSIRDTFSNMDLTGNHAMDSSKVNGTALTESAPSLTHLTNAFEEVRKFWSDRFFTSSYLIHDRPYLGAVDFVRNLHNLGAHIVYLTGRDEPNMGEGTRANLIRDGFPWAIPRTQLLMKPVGSMDDLVFKKQAAMLVNGQGKLIASFENEPPNVSALHELLPEVMHVFVDTVCSDQVARPRKGLYRIPGFVS
jgi:hypothetical protein